MFAAIGFGIVIIGTIVACIAPHVGRLTAPLEVAGGMLVVAGLALIGTQIAARTPF